MSLRLLFLDIDGVLNDPGTWNRPDAEAGRPDRDKTVRLSKLADDLDLQIVISSSSRYEFSLDTFRERFAEAGFARPERIIDVTPLVDYTASKGDEIQAWLNVHAPEGAHFIILDDLGLSSFEGLGRHLIQTNGAIGLTDRDCVSAAACFHRLGFHL